MKKISRDAIQRMVGGISSSSSVIGGGGGGGGGVSQYWVDENYVSKEFFNRLFEIHDENGDPILPNDVETEIDNIQAMFGFWTNAYLSALGQNEGGGGAELTLASLADVAVHGVTDGQALVWNAAQGKWVPGQGGGGGTVTSIRVGTTSYSPVGGVVSLPDYVTLATAQTITGLKTMTHGLVVSGRVYSSGDDEGIVVGIARNNFAGITLGTYNGTHATLYYDNNNQSSYWRFVNNEAYNIYHPQKSGTIALTSDIPTSLDDISDGSTRKLSNYLPLSGGTMTNTTVVTNMNADLLDGHHATDFALASAITDMATQTWVSTNYLTKTDANNTYLSISFFRALFRAYTSGGSEVVPNDGNTSTIDNIKAMFGFWTNSYLSALGNNPGGASLTLSSLSDVSISGATAGQVLTYRNGTWRNETPQGGGGTVTAVKVGSTSYSPTDGVVSLPAYPSTLDDIADGSTRKLADYVTLTTAQTITGLKTMTHGLVVSGRVYSSGDDEGIVVGIAPNNFAGITLGSYNGAHATLYYNKNNQSSYWRFVNNEAYEIYHPQKSGTIALTSDIPTSLDDISDGSTRKLSNYLPLSGGTMTGEIIFSYGTSATDQWIKFVASNDTTYFLGIRRPFASYGFSIYDGVKYYRIWHEGNLKNISQLTNDSGYITSDASITGNAGSATKLKTARTIWGQSFDGTANVSGAITDATTITASSNVSVGGTLGVTGATTLSSTLSVSGNATLGGDILMSSGGRIHIANEPSGASLYIGNSNDAGWVYMSDMCSRQGDGYWKVYSNGNSEFANVYSRGYVTALSDIRHKDIQGDVGLTVIEVANAPSVKFLWKDRRQEGLQVGSIAQYWQKVMPEAIVEAADGELTMSYGVIALLASIANAREIVNLKREIAELKRKLSNHGTL